MSCTMAEVRSAIALAIREARTHSRNRYGGKLDSRVNCYRRAAANLAHYAEFWRGSARTSRDPIAKLEHQSRATRFGTAAVICESMFHHANRTIPVACRNVPGGWQSEGRDGETFGPVFNEVRALWDWQKQYRAAAAEGSPHGA